MPFFRSRLFRNPIRAPKRLSVERLEARRVLAAYLNEFHFSPLFGENTTDQYLEIRGTPSGTLDAGTYFVGIESADGVHELGDVHTVIDLGGQSLGANGLLVLLQSGGGYAVNTDATVLRGADGFLGMPGDIYQADGDAKAIHAGSGTYLLIQSNTAPQLSDDIDANDDGVPDGAYLGWSILDGFSALPSVESLWNQRTYAPIVFRENGVGDGFLPGSTLIDSDQLAYAGRIAQSTEFTDKDWLTGNTQEKAGTPWEFQLQHGVFGTPRPFAYAGRVLDHVGDHNWHGSISGSVFQDDNADGIQQPSEPGVGGVTVFADVSGATSGHFWETIEPNDHPVDADLTNISPNVTLVSAGSDNVHQSFKARAVQRPFAPVGEHIFAHEGVGFFNENRRLRMDFYRPARSVAIDVIGNSDSSPTYGRLEIFAEDGTSLGFVRTQPLGADDLQTLMLTSANDNIAWAVAYSEDSYLGSSPFGKLDRLRIEVRRASATTSADGHFSISPLNQGNYIVSSSTPPNYYPVSPIGGTHTVALDQNEAAQGVGFGFKGFEPPNLIDQSVSAGELLQAGDVIATLPVMLGYPTQELQFSILSGDPDGQFTIDPNTFELKSTRGDLDFETKNRYVLEVRLQDVNVGSFNDTATIEVSLNDENDTPQVTPQEVDFDENLSGGTLIATMQGSDQDAGSAGEFTWSIVDGNADNTFAIDEQSGEVTIANPEGFDFESHPTFELTVQATDRGLPARSGNATLTVRLGDLNEPPVIVSQEFHVDENTDQGQVVGQLVADEQDVGQTTQWSVLGGSGQGWFDVDGDGTITVANGAALNFEVTPTFILEVQASDSGAPALSDSRSVTIQLTDVNDAPAFSPQSLDVAENAVSATPVGTVAAADEDAGQTLTYAITGGNGASAFEIDAETGALSVAEGAELDFEATPQLSLEVTATDSHQPVAETTGTITIQLTDVNEAPRITEEGFSVPENSTAGTRVGMLEAMDPDAGDQLTFEIVQQSANWLTVQPQTGELVVADGANIDYERDGQITATVRATDTQGLVGEAIIVVAATDANDAPTLAQPIDDLEAEVGKEFRLVIPDGTFADEDANDSLQLFVTTSTGFSLPDWLSYDAAARTLSGTPAEEDVGTLSFRVRAVDESGAGVADFVDLVVADQPLPWHNGSEVYDVSDDGFVTPIDALMVINYLNSGEAATVPPNAPPSFGFIDVNGDNFVTPIDALMVINRINSGSGGGGESAGAPLAPPPNGASRDWLDDRKDDDLLELLAYERASFFK